MTPRPEQVMFNSLGTSCAGDLYVPEADAPVPGLVLGHSGVMAVAEEDGFSASTSTAIDAARILFPPGPIWRSPLDGATA